MAGRELGRKGLGNTSRHKLKQQCALAAEVANSLLGCIRKSTARRQTKVILSFCAAPARPQV